MTYSELIEKIKKERSYQDFTQQEMADKIPMERTAYAKVESGTRMATFNEMISICRILRIDLTKEFHLLEGEEEKEHHYD